MADNYLKIFLVNIDDDGNLEKVPLFRHQWVVGEKENQRAALDRWKEQHDDD